MDNRTDRILRLLAHLRSGSANTVTELAEKCMSSRRGVMRDIELLRSHDYAIEYDDCRHTFQLRDQCRIRGAKSLRAQELGLLAVAVALSPIRRLPDVENRITAAWTTILGEVPPEEQMEIRRLFSLCEVIGETQGACTHLGKLLLRVLRALNSGQNLRITYLSSDGAWTTAEVIPHRLVFSQDEWQLDCRLRAERSPLSVVIRTLRNVVPLEEGSGMGMGKAAAWDEGSVRTRAAANGGYAIESSG